jgi:hypothetical protein
LYFRSFFLDWLVCCFLHRTAHVSPDWFFQSRTALFFFISFHLFSYALIDGLVDELNDDMMY